MGDGGAFFCFFCFFSKEDCDTVKSHLTWRTSCFWGNDRQHRHPVKAFLKTSFCSPLGDRQGNWFCSVWYWLVGFVSSLYFFYFFIYKHMQSRLHRHLLTTLRFLSLQTRWSKITFFLNYLSVLLPSWWTEFKASRLEIECLCTYNQTELLYLTISG